MRAFGKITAIISLLTVILNFFSCGGDNSYRHCEILLSLPEEYESAPPDEPFLIYDASGGANMFLLSSSGSVDMAFTDSVSVISLSRISKEAAYDEGIPPIMSQLEFARYYRSQSGGGTEVMLHSEIPYYTYTKTSDGGGELSFLMTFYATPNAYFIISYITASDRAVSLENSFLDIAADVEFTE